MSSIIIKKNKNKETGMWDTPAQFIEDGDHPVDLSEENQLKMSAIMVHMSQKFPASKMEVIMSDYDGFTVEVNRGGKLIHERFKYVNTELVGSNLTLY